ncbi:response regulator [Aeribacillus sp. FSL K6-2848]|nr:MULTISPECIES: response regulator [Aeribacillus]MDR9797215.1 response regulator [Aeribacillus pallidus]MED0651815.1 response regulator [Aeribacillus composti]MED1438473.1 response regulator [Aeribacillus composti]MED4486349.1 response regulator [Aeribacillus pallidus]TVZ85795.1 two-component system response regulator DctR [Aeribacillus composti]
MNKKISVLLIEDDPMVQEVNKQFIQKVDGFTVIGIAGNGKEGIELVRELKPELVIIDIYMPNQDGLETLKQIRSEGHSVDVIAITAARDMETVRRVLQNGAFDYIMKPFKFERLQQSLKNYLLYHSQLKEKEKLTQKDVDTMLLNNKFKNKPEDPDLPKGLNQVTLDKIIRFLQNQKEPISAEEVAEGIGIARVTARRYLDYLAKIKKVSIHVQYGSIGRPVNRYMFHSD